jgi:hypothetical protein
MTTITDDDMKGMLAKVRTYTLVLLHPGPNYAMENSRPIIWEHGRRNFGLRADGKVALVGPLDATDDPVGIYAFTTNRDETVRLMDDDPAVKAGLFTYTVHNWRSFPGDTLP